MSGRAVHFALQHRPHMETMSSVKFLIFETLVYSSVSSCNSDTLGLIFRPPIVFGNPFNMNTIHNSSRFRSVRLEPFEFNEQSRIFVGIVFWCESFPLACDFPVWEGRNAEFLESLEFN